MVCPVLACCMGKSASQEPSAPGSAVTEMFPSSTTVTVPFAQPHTRGGSGARARTIFESMTLGSRSADTQRRPARSGKAARMSCTSSSRDNLADRKKSANEHCIACSCVLVRLRVEAPTKERDRYIIYRVSPIMYDPILQIQAHICTCTCNRIAFVYRHPHLLGDLLRGLLCTLQRPAGTSHRVYCERSVAPIRPSEEPLELRMSPELKLHILLCTHLLLFSKQEAEFVYYNSSSWRPQARDRPG